MPEPPARLEHLLHLREELFTALAAADAEFGRVRMQVERMESDLRCGLPEPAGYQEAKGHLLPRAEAEVVNLFRELNKLEDKIALARKVGR